MAYEIYTASQEAMKRLLVNINDPDPFGTSEPSKHGYTKYPFDQLHIAQAFIVPMAEAKYSVLANTAWNKGNHSGKKFTLVTHREAGIIEVARIR